MNTNEGGNQQEQYYHYSALRTTANLTDRAGNLQVSYRSGVWGKITEQQGQSANRHIFTGQEHDEKTGLIYFGARFYDPDTARFINQDTYLGEANTPPSLHRYLYVYANPTVYIDPDGYSPMEFGDVTPEEAASREPILEDTVKGLANFLIDGVVDDIETSEDLGDFTNKRTERAKEDFKDGVVQGTLVTACGAIKICKAIKKGAEKIYDKVTGKNKTDITKEKGDGPRGGNQQEVETSQSATDEGETKELSDFLKGDKRSQSRKHAQEAEADGCCMTGVWDPDDAAARRKERLILKRA